MDFQNALKALKSQEKVIKSRYSLKKISEKGAFDYVTNVDVEIQENLRRLLLNAYPDVGFWSEEGHQPDLTKPYWLLDPLDGTTNFIHDYGISTISLAYVANGEVYFGAILNPYTKELFTAIKGKGAFRNGTQISVSKNEIGKSLISFGTNPYDKRLFKKLLSILETLFPMVQDIRRSGSAAYDLAQVAAGRTEGFFEQVLRPWDYAAGSLIVSEAGGIISDMDGAPLSFEKPGSVLASNASTHVVLLNMTKEAHHESCD